MRACREMPGTNAWKPSSGRVGAVLESVRVVLVVLLIIGGGAVFGLFIGRWWAVLVPPAVGWIVFERTPKEGNDLAAFPLVWAAVVTLGVLMGVALRKLAGGRDDPLPPS